MDKKVVELFAGVGGFRLGLEKSGDWETVWANQWEPGRKNQFAYDCYVRNFGASDKHSNENLMEVEKNTVPDHTLLVGGFPCQDYSVASTGAKGIEGKKGVLWWEIREILEKKRPPFVLLENVDRLLKSPTSQRGRDFAVMLFGFHELGYNVEWRVINAAEYGNVQRRRRVFIYAHQRNLNYATQTKNIDSLEMLLNKGFFSDTFPVKDQIKDLKKETKEEFAPTDTMLDVSNNFQAAFFNAGIMRDGFIHTAEVAPIQVEPQTLGSILETTPVDEKYFLAETEEELEAKAAKDIQSRIEKFKYLKGAKRILRYKPNGEPYYYAEGSMGFPDPLDKPARTMLTSESSVNRSTHVVTDYQTELLRLITPVEAERINGFNDNWTDGMSDKQRYFCMGNALVVPLITKMGTKLISLLEQED